MPSAAIGTQGASESPMALARKTPSGNCQSAHVEEGHDAALFSGLGALGFRERLTGVAADDPAGGVHED